MKSVLICNGGGPTAVINLTNMGIVEGCLDYTMGKVAVYAAIGGTGALIGEHASHDGKRHIARIDTLLGDNHARQLVKNTPSTWIGSGRYKLGGKVPDERSGGSPEGAIDYDIGRVLDVCDQLAIEHVFFVGGDDTLTTLNGLAAYADRHPERTCYPTFLSVPKTIDNDLPDAVADPDPGADDEGCFKDSGRIMVVDACPGFGTAANFVANKVAHLAVEARALGRHYIIEVMGRDAGFLTAASIVGAEFGYGPHLVALPEHGPFDLETFVNLVATREKSEGYGVYCVSEGIRDSDYRPLASRGRDLFGNERLGGAGERLADEAGAYCKQRGIGADVRCIKFGELQRVSAVYRSAADTEIAYQVGHRAAYWAIERGRTGKLVTIVRQPSATPTWAYGLVDTRLVSGKDKKRAMDPAWVEAYTYGALRVPTVDPSFLDYLSPLVDPIVPIAPAFAGRELEL